MIQFCMRLSTSIAMELRTDPGSSVSLYIGVWFGDTCVVCGVDCCCCGVIADWLITGCNGVMGG